MTSMSRLLIPAVVLLFAAPLAKAAGNLPDFTELVERTSPAVVNIEATRSAQSQRRDSRGGGGQDELPEFFRRFFGEPGMPQPPRDSVSGGSGFIISADGEVLTNHHVIDGADTVIVRLPDRREFEAEVVGSDPQSDIALLRIDATGLPTLPLGDSRQLRAGQWVIAIGSPFGFLENTVTAGIVSGTGRQSRMQGQNYVPFIQTDVAINRGNSGGPLLNVDGEVVGINSQIFSNSGGFMGVSFAIPTDVAMNAVRQLRETGEVRRGLLGVVVQQVTRELARELGMERSIGALVTSVEPGSAAAGAGVRRGDVIVAFNGQEVTSSGDLPPMVGNIAPGTDVTITVRREGRERQLNATLGDTSPQAAASPRSRPAGQAAPEAGPLGIAVEALSAEDRESLGLGRNEGVRVAAVTGESARRAMIRPGDVILMVGQRDVGSPADFQRQVRDLAEGDTVMVLVRSPDGQSRFVTLTAQAG